MPGETPGGAVELPVQKLLKQGAGERDSGQRRSEWAESAGRGRGAAVDLEETLSDFQRFLRDSLARLNRTETHTNTALCWRKHRGTVFQISALPRLQAPPTGAATPPASGLLHDIDAAISYSR